MEKKPDRKSYNIEILFIFMFLLLHLVATLLQAFFPALQEAEFYKVRHNPWRLVYQNDADFY